MIVFLVEKKIRRINLDSISSTNTIATNWYFMVNNKSYHSVVSCCNLYLSKNKEDRENRELEVLKKQISEFFRIDKTKIVFKKQHQ